MDTRLIHRWSSALEWLSFVLATPEIIGPRRLKQLSTFLRRAAAATLVIGDAFISWRWPAPVPDEQLAEKIRSFATPFRLGWRPGLGRQFLLIVLLPASILVALTIAGAFLLRGPARLWAATPLVLGVGCVLVVARYQFNLIRPKARRPVASYTVVLLFWVAFSFVTWAVLPIAMISYGLLRMSETRLLRGVLFALGAILFTVAKAADFLNP